MLVSDNFNSLIELVWFWWSSCLAFWVEDWASIYILQLRYMIFNLDLMTNLEMMWSVHYYYNAKPGMECIWGSLHSFRAFRPLSSFKTILLRYFDTRFGYCWDILILNLELMTNVDQMCSISIISLSRVWNMIIWLFELLCTFTIDHPNSYYSAYRWDAPELQVL